MLAGGRQLVGAEWLERNACVDTGAELLVFVLKLIKLPIEAALSEKLLMRATLAELAFVHDEYCVSSLHCGKAMRDENTCATRDHAL